MLWSPIVNAGLYGYPASDGESALLPALRVLIGTPQSANYQFDFLVVDLAPVEADTEDGVTVSCPPGSYAPNPSMPLNCELLPTDNSGGKATNSITVVVKSPPDAVYNQINDLKNWNNWMPWNKMDRNMQVTWGGGPTAGRLG